jgi:hypothetical protein
MNDSAMLRRKTNPIAAGIPLKQRRTFFTQSPKQQKRGTNRQQTACPEKSHGLNFTLHPKMPRQALP